MTDAEVSNSGLVDCLANGTMEIYEVSSHAIVIPNGITFFRLFD